MGSVNRLRRSVAPTLVIARLVRLGYLRPAKRYKPNVILQAVERLKSDLWHVGIPKMAISQKSIKPRGVRLNKKNRPGAKRARNMRRKLLLVCQPFKFNAVGQAQD